MPSRREVGATSPELGESKLSMATSSLPHLHLFATVSIASRISWNGFARVVAAGADDGAGVVDGGDEQHRHVWAFADGPEVDCRQGAVVTFDRTPRRPSPNS